MPLYLRLDIDVDGKVQLYARNNKDFTGTEPILASGTTASQALREYAAKCAYKAGDK